MDLESSGEVGNQQIQRDVQHPSSDRIIHLVTRWLEVSTIESDGRERVELERDNIEPADQARIELPGKQHRGSTHDKNRLTLQASLESEDRAGDVIRAEGWELDNYRLNPVILWAHRHDLLPVGKSTNVWVESGALMAEIEFAPTEFAQQVRRMFEDGFLRGVSVGFRALKTSPRSGGGNQGIVFERQELLEISAAPKTCITRYVSPTACFSLMVSGAGGRYPSELCGLSVLYSLLHFSVSISTSLSE